MLPVHTFLSDPVISLAMLSFAYNDRLNTKEIRLDCLLFFFSFPHHALLRSNYMLNTIPHLEDSF